MSGAIVALFQRLTQGVYVVGVADGDVRNASRWVKAYRQVMYCRQN